MLGLYKNIIRSDLEEERKDVVLQIMVMKEQQPLIALELEQEKQKNLILRRRVAMYQAMIKEA